MAGAEKIEWRRMVRNCMLKPRPGSRLIEFGRTKGRETNETPGIYLRDLRVRRFSRELYLHDRLCRRSVGTQVGRFGKPDRCGMRSSSISR